jgi:hypothetical protein
VDDWQPAALRQLHETVYYAVTFGAGHEYRKVREDVAALCLDGDALAEISRLDELALEHVLRADEEDVWPGLLEDDPTLPLDHWWWHLGAIRKGTFPTDRLPKHLREVITSAANASAPPDCSP